MCYGLLLALGGFVVQVSSVEASQHKQRLYNSDPGSYLLLLTFLLLLPHASAAAAAAAAAATSFLLSYTTLNLFMLYSHPQPQPAQTQAASLA